MNVALVAADRSGTQRPCWFGRNKYLFVIVYYERN